MASDQPTAAPECRICLRAGYVTRRGPRWAAASVCDCRTPCPICDGRHRVIRREENGRTYVADCVCRGLTRRVALFNAAQLPAAYHNKSLDGFRCETRAQELLVHHLRHYQEHGRPGHRGILLAGNPGVGKTHLLCALLSHLSLEMGLSCRYVDVFQLLEDLRATFDHGGGSSQLMDETMTVPILGLDELGKARTTGWQLEVLDQIISRRYNSGLTTVVTTNYALPDAGVEPRAKETDWSGLVSKETLVDRIGVRIYSRLREMCRIFVLDGGDHRLAR